MCPCPPLPWVIGEPAPTNVAGKTVHMECLVHGLRNKCYMRCCVTRPSSPVSWPGCPCPPEAECGHHTRSTGGTPGRSSQPHSKPKGTYISNSESTCFVSGYFKTDLVVWVEAVIIFPQRLGAGGAAETERVVNTRHSLDKLYIMGVQKKSSKILTMEAKTVKTNKRMKAGQKWLKIPLSCHYFVPL